MCGAGAAIVSCWLMFWANATAAAVILLRLAALFPPFCLICFLYFDSRSCVAHKNTHVCMYVYADRCGIVYQAPIILRSYFDCLLCCGVRCVTFTLLTYIPIHSYIPQPIFRYAHIHTYINFVWVYVRKIQWCPPSIYCFC